MEGRAIIIIKHCWNNSAYIHGFKSKYIFFNRTIPTKQNHMKCTEEILWMTSSAKTQYKPSKEKSVRVKATSKREGTKLKYQPKQN